MRKYVQRNLTPSSGYFYTVPETGLEIVAGDHDSLVHSVYKHRVANKLPFISDLAARIEHFICLKNDASFCKGEYEEGDQQDMVISVRQIKDATRLIISKITMGEKSFMVAPAESERRALVCVGCSDNFRGMCTTCNGLKAYVAERIANRTTPHDHLLGVCAHCSCLLKAKVHVSCAALKTITTAEDLTKLPAHCWMQDILKEDKAHAGN